MPGSDRQIAQFLFLLGQAADEAGVAEDAVAIILDRLAVLRQRYIQRLQAPDDRRHRAVGQAHFRVEEEFAGLEQRQRDRKSTRLNSSHSQISYAVFCLKKKKKKKKEK